LKTELSDLDGDQVTLNWFPYPEAGTYRGVPRVRDNTQAVARVDIPPVQAPADMHLVCEVRDDGVPPLIVHRRVVIEVRP
jgi:hypothetical protein